MVEQSDSGTTEQSHPLQASQRANQDSAETRENRTKSWLQKIIPGISWAVWSLLIALEALIAIRILLSLLGILSTYVLTAKIFNLTDFLLEPFMRFTTPVSGGDVVVEIPALIGMLVFALAGGSLIRLLGFISRHLPNG